MKNQEQCLNADRKARINVYLKELTVKSEVTFNHVDNK